MAGTHSRFSAVGATTFTCITACICSGAVAPAVSRSMRAALCTTTSRSARPR
mgnify:CR=1 FL=1